MKTLLAAIALLPFAAHAEFDPNPGRYWGSQQQYRDDNARIEQQRQMQQMQERMEERMKEQRRQFERQQDSYDRYNNYGNDRY